MSSSLSFFAFAALSASLVSAQTPTGTFPATPLASKTFSSPSALPYQVDTDVGLIRGTQHGFNICNSTTENQQSLCQTSYFTSADDFCIWAPSEPDSIVANTEGEMVAWCTKPGHGTRLIPEGALTGLQFIQTPDYVQAIGFLDQSLVNIKTGDYGGEMDPHGADLRGNPMGGVVFSGAFGGGGVKQVIEWHNFIGGDKFCFKACDPAGPNAAHFCEHIFDRIGCDYNIPNAAKDGVFESCKGDNQDFPGVYTENGVVMTYTQPAESLGAISTMPYQPKVPSSSQCSSFVSSAVYTGLPKPSVTSASSSASVTGTAAGTTSRPGNAPPTTGSKTGSAAAASNTTASGAGKVAVSGVVAALAAMVVFMS